jgi:ribonucleoside-triphosphate reductase
MTATPSTRAQIVEARTYLRPIDDEGNVFETPAQAAERIIGHQRWLWERAKGGMHRVTEIADLPPLKFDDPVGYRVEDGWVMIRLTDEEEAELQELKTLFLDRKLTVAGRTRWLGGTAIAKERESSQFNCSFLEVRNVHDVVDATWLLLQGCGVGFRPVVGTLNGFAQPMEIEVIRSRRGPYKKGPENNVETFDPVTKTWTIKVGDSSSAWAKSAGKLVAGKFHAKKLVLDFSLVRGGGGRLKNYGWISSGDEQIAKAYLAIAQILNTAAGRLLTRIEILDIMNWLGTILSSRRSAEIAVMAHGEPEWQDFALAKKDMWTTGRDHRQMSNNSIMFYQKPTKYQLSRIFKMMMDAGGSEPGFINAQAAMKRAPWFKGVNPCCEIMLGDRSFCNLVETVLPRFNDDIEGLHRAHWLVARANYRQTCVNLDDGVLQRGWHELNEFLRLCGVGVTGVVAWDYWRDSAAWEDLRDSAVSGANSMADELGMPRAKAVTTVKPSGTQSKALGIVGHEVPEGIHTPIGRYIFNRIRFSAHDPIIAKLRAANYDIEPDPSDPTGVLAVIPVEFSGIKFGKVKRGGKTIEVNTETAIEQLERYKLLMDNYVDHNASITITYDPEEVPDIVDWLMANWDSYVGVSFIYRQDATRTAADLGYKYLPQTLVDKDTYQAYTERLLPVDLSGDAASEMLADSMECAGGACPVR